MRQGNAPEGVTDPRRDLGALGERLAERYLSDLGCRIVERNFRTRYGELDIVAADDRCLVFCEVKTRLAATEGAALPLEGIGPRKRRRLRLMAAQWLASRSPPRRPLRRELRFDAIGVIVSPSGEILALEHLEDAL